MASVARSDFLGPPIRRSACRGSNVPAHVPPDATAWSARDRLSSVKRGIVVSGASLAVDRSSRPLDEETSMTDVQLPHERLDSGRERSVRDHEHVALIERLEA